MDQRQRFKTSECQPKWAQQLVDIRENNGLRAHD
jgi:hypothetical protein